MFLSFIVTIYNTEQYLDECLQSLLDQDVSADDYEVVCVNDGSTDGSLEILERYGREYSHIRVISQENGGVCTARNTGLNAAKGDYIWYIDADDFIEKQTLAQIQTEILRTNCDRLVVGSCDYISGSEQMPVNTAWQDTVVWRNLFRREFLLKNNLLFHYPELSFGEDGLYMYEVKRQMPKTEEFRQPVYYHRSRPGSLSSEMSVHTEEKRLRCNIREAEILKDYYEAGGILEEETANRFMSFLWGALYRVALMPGKMAAVYLQDMKRRGLYPYKRPEACTITKCPEVKRNDLVGKLFDCLYTNLGSRWGYWGMRLVQQMFRIKHHLLSPIRGKKL